MRANTQVRPYLKMYDYALPGWFPSIELDAFVVMPNHVHLVVCQYGSDGVVEVEATRDTHACSYRNQE